MVEQGVGGVEFLDLPCLASRQNLNLNPNDMAGLRSQCTVVDGDNDAAPENIPYEVP